MAVPEKYLKNKVLYSDNVCTAILCDGAKGHIKVFSNNFKRIDDIPSGFISHMFFLANFCATSTFENLGATGTNLIVNNNDDLFCIDVVSRYENDGINFMWELKQGNPKELDEVMSRIKDETILIESRLKNEQKPKEEPKPELPKKESYVIESKKGGTDIKDKRLAYDIPNVPKEYLDEEKYAPDIESKENNYLISELRRIP